MSSVASRRVSKADRAALFSAVVPGWGHAYVGLVRTAYVLFVVDVLLVVALVLMAGPLRWETVKLWVRPEALLVIMVLNVLFLGYRAFAVAGAYRAAVESPRGLAGGVWMVLAVALLVMPHLLIGYYSWVQYDLIRSLFPSNPIAADTTTTSSTVPPTTTTVSGSSSTSSTTTTVPTTTTTAPPMVWDGLDRLNILLLGADAGPGRVGTRTDTTIVVSIDPSTGEVAMISIPRNLSNVPLPDGMGIWDCNCFPDLLTHLYDAAERHPEAFPGPGEPWFNAVKGAVGELLGIPIHFYAMVTLNGFVGVVDALGGVTIDVPKTIVDPTYPHEDGSVVRIEIREGRQHLDGHMALAYARIRRPSDDFARMHRQRCVLGAVVEQTNPLELLLGFPRLARALKANMSTDIPQEHLVDFVDLVPKVSTDRITSLRIDRSYRTGGAPGRTYYDLARIHREFQLILDDPVGARETLGLTGLDDTCDESYD